MADRILGIFLGSIFLGAGLMAAEPSPTPAPAAADVLASVRARVDAARAAVPGAATAVERARLLLAIGRHDAALELVDELGGEGLDGELVAAEVLEAVHEYPALARRVAALVEAHPDHAEVRRLAHRWWLLSDDLKRMDETLSARRVAGDLTVADRLAAADLDARRLDFASARLAYEHLLGEELTPLDRARALGGLGRVDREQRDYEASLDHLRRALELSPPDAEWLASYAETLIRLGRTEEAIAALALGAEIGPYHIRTHYLLGSGYARKSYTQLLAARPDSFASGDELAALGAADRLLGAGKPAGARAAYLRLAAAHPRWVDVLARLGSLAYAEGDTAAARRHYRRALELCPEYGRAHIGLARTLEACRLAAEVHHHSYEERFAGAAMPEIDTDLTERYVLNWRALSPRHRKRVALSLAPWRRYLPVLVEAGATLYIKPLYQLLSETPEQEVLRDQRISYDSRLWDDVRGCGGYHTVAGIEDVETTIANGYDTVIHELTHQVHMVLPEASKRTIQELYRKSKEREAAGTSVFLSRYAGGSVWEYFAEGANAASSPRRDAYDTREIVRERLIERDPPLANLVSELMERADIEPCYALGYASRGDDQLERGRPQEAIAAYHQALERAPGLETATASLSFALAVEGKHAEALAAAREAAAAEPASADLALRYADARWLAGEGVEAAIATLEKARRRVRRQERYRIDQELGNLHWIAGETKAASKAFARVLRYQADNPEGLWGTALAHAQAGRWKKAWASYEEAVRQRTGIVDLRVDYALDRLRAGELERSTDQVAAALLLDAEDPRALAVQALLRVAEGRAAEARAVAARALELGPWCDLARIARAAAERAAGDRGAAARTLRPLRQRITAGSPPEYVYRAKWGRYDRVHTLPAIERTLLAGLE